MRLHSQNILAAASLLLLITIIESRGPLLVEPAYLLVEEDWPLSKPLPVTICPGTVRILSGDSGRHFSISKLNATCSTLSLNKELEADRDGGQSFSLVLAGKRQSRASLDIQVVDVNDNPPLFLAAPAILSLREDTPEGSAVTKIRTTDPDTGVGGLVRFSIDDNPFFAVDKQKCSSGECWTTLKLKKALDFEKQKTHEVVITAEDGDPEKKSHSTKHTIAIQVLDVQDEAPIWKSELRAEASSVGQQILQLSAVDGDEGGKNEIRYLIEQNDYLSLDSVTGTITVIKMPSEAGEKSFSVTAKEQDGNGQTAIGQLVVNFSSSSSSSTSSLSSPLCPSVTRGKVKAGILETLTINFSRPITGLRLEAGEAFKVTGDDRSARIELQQPELLASKSKWEFYVATDQGRCRVEVETETAPRFEHDNFLFYITENSPPSLLGSVAAVGKGIRYSLLGNGAEQFAVSSDGQLSSLRAVDREQFDRFDLTVRVTDENGKWTDCRLKIVIKDVNDNAPRFEKEIYEITVDEEKSIKQRITAIDPDLGENGNILYSLEDVPDGVPIDFSQGILFIGKLDRDTMDSENLTLTLRATDKGQPARSSSAEIVITVKDVNDNYPVFTNSRYSLVLDANISPGGVVGAVSAEDADATKPNNYIRYTTDDGRFRITDGGEIIYDGQEVLSKETSIEFAVTATDGGTPPRNATSKVALNEHKKALQSELTTQLNETGERQEIEWANSRMPGYSYELVRASAKGYKDSEVKGWVDLDQKTGVIHTKRSLTPELVKQIRLQISMRKGKREVPVELIINVVDNDTTPSFRKDIYRAILPEDTAIGTRVLQVNASPENIYKYQLAVRDGPKDALRIDNNGWLTVARRLDYEKYKKLHGLVKATNGEGDSSTTNFTLILTNVNDNRPIFKNGSVFTVLVREDLPVGTVLDLPYPLATDEDEGDNSRLEYDLMGGEGFFSINKSNSTITLLRSLDFETQRAHSLPIRVTDGSHEVFGAITVQVEDANDNKPQILNADLMQLSVAEDVTVGMVVTSLAATDADEGGAQTVRSSSNSSLFRVDDEGKLVVAQGLKGYAGERICGSITARDSGEPALETIVPFCVTIYPAAYNTHSPLIVSPKQNSIHYFDENVELDELLRIKVLDEGDLANVSFALDTEFKRDWEAFRVNSSGSLLTRAPFDFEKKAVHELKVKACRAANCTSVHLFISVNDRNDNCPIFPRGDVLLSVVENEKSDKGQSSRMVGRFPAAHDADFHADNTKVCYASDSPHFFFKDPSLPVLYTNTTFDREQLTEHRVTITAYDCLLSCRDPFKPANATLIAVVKVEDVNDNFPRFSQKTFQATLIQGQASPGSHLTTLTATDADEEKDGLRFSIKGAIRSAKMTYPPGSDGPITLDPSTGEVSANEALRESSYSFTAAVTDGVGHEDTAVVTVAVVTYSQQAELLFDAPFDFIVRNEKHIVSLLTDATKYKAVIDRCRQNTNFTLVLAHFLDSDGQFIEIDRAVGKLMTSNSSARRELRSAYGLRDIVIPETGNPRQLTMTAFAGMAVLLSVVALLVVVCLCCRSRNKYDSKLRTISQQAVLHHQHTLGRRPTKVLNPSLFCVDRSGRMAPPPPPLQSTEL